MTPFRLKRRPWPMRAWNHYRIFRGWGLPVWRSVKHALVMARGVP